MLRVGSSRKTSSAAAAMCPECSAASTAASSTSLAASAVHQAHAGLHFGDGLGVDHAGGLMGQRQVQRNVVGLGVKRVDRDQLDAQFLGARGRQIGIAADELHAEGAGSQRGLRADPAQADDAERLAGQLGALQTLLVPLAGAGGLVGARRYGAPWRASGRA